MASAPNRSTSQKDYLKVVWKTSHKIYIVSRFFSSHFIHTIDTNYTNYKYAIDFS